MLSLCLSGHFVCILDFTEAKEYGGGVRTGTVRCTLPTAVKSSTTTTSILFFTGRMPFQSPRQQCQNTEGKVIIFHGLDHPKLTWGSSNLALLLITVTYE